MMFIFHLLDMTKPCAEPLCDAEIYGHHSKRYCDSCARARRRVREREYKRERRKDAEYREQLREREREYRKDPAFRERKREYAREYRKDPTVKERDRERRKDAEYRERMREYQREYRKDPAFRERMREYQRERYEQTKTPCVDCGKLVSPSAERCSSCATKACWRDLDFVERFYAGRQPQGTRYIGFAGARKLILERDEGVCQTCGGFPDSIDVHHIDVDDNNQHWSNLISLCDPCHHQAHTAYRNGSKAVTQENLTRKAEVQSARMSAEWHDEYGALLERIEMRAPLPERHDPTQQMLLPFVIQ